MIWNLEEENIIMKYRWHSRKHGYIDASWFTWIFIETKRGKVEIEEEHIMMDARPAHKIRNYRT